MDISWISDTSRSIMWVETTQFLTPQRKKNTWTNVSGFFFCLLKVLHVYVYLYSIMSWLCKCPFFSCHQSYDLYKGRWRFYRSSTTIKKQNKQQNYDYTTKYYTLQYAKSINNPAPKSSVYVATIGKAVTLVTHVRTNEQGKVSLYCNIDFIIGFPS